MSKKKKTILSQFLQLRQSQDSAFKPFVFLLTKRKLQAIGHLPDKEDSIEKVFKRCAILVYMMFKVKTNREKLLNVISSMLESLRENKWTTFLDKLSSLSREETNTLHIMLFKILVLELISNARDCKPFWTPAYKELSEQLWSPIVIDSLDSLSHLSNTSSLEQGEISPLSTTWNVIVAKQASRNSQKTSFPLSTSTAVNKWAEENIESTSAYCRKLRIFPSNSQKKVLDEWLQTSTYIFNKALHKIQVDKVAINKDILRDLIVTKTSRRGDEGYKTYLGEVKELKKNLKLSTCTESIERIKNDLERLRQTRLAMAKTENKEIEEWELRTPKEIRYNAVRDVVKAHESGFAMLKKGIIKFFRLKPRLKMEEKSISLEANQISFDGHHFKIMPTFFGKDECLLSTSLKRAKELEDLHIKGGCRLMKRGGNYYINVTLKRNILKKRNKPTTMCGIDLGIRDFATVYTPEKCLEYKHPRKLLGQLNYKLKRLRKGLNH